MTTSLHWLRWWEPWQLLLSRGGAGPGPPLAPGALDQPLSIWPRFPSSELQVLGSPALCTPPSLRFLGLLLIEQPPPPVSASGWGPRGPPVGLAPAGSSPATCPSCTGLCPVGGCADVGRESTGQEAQQGDVAASCHLAQCRPAPKPVPSPYLDRPGTPEALSSWWMLRAHCPARGMPWDMEPEGGFRNLNPAEVGGGGQPRGWAAAWSLVSPHAQCPSQPRGPSRERQASASLGSSELEVSLSPRLLQALAAAWGRGGGCRGSHVMQGGPGEAPVGRSPAACGEAASCVGDSVAGREQPRSCAHCFLITEPSGPGPARPPLTAPVLTSQQLPPPAQPVTLHPP